VDYHVATIYFSLYSNTQKSLERSRLPVCADCDKRGCTRASAANTFDIQQVNDGVHCPWVCPRWGAW